MSLNHSKTIARIIVVSTLFYGDSFQYQKAWTDHINGEKFIEYDKYFLKSFDECITEAIEFLGNDDDNIKYIVTTMIKHEYHETIEWAHEITNTSMPKAILVWTL